MFCDKCGALMIPTTDRKGKRLLKCAACAYSKSTDHGDDYTIQQKIIHSERDETLIIESPEQFDQLPTAKMSCPKCNYGKASYWQSQVQVEDEDATIFYRCKQCGHTWRDDS